MNFITQQSKLTKEEWTSIEVPCSDSEKRILSLIEDGYNDVNIRRNYTLSLARYIKITHPEKFSQYLYENYFQKHMDELSKKYKQFFPDLVEIISSCVFKKCDGNSSKQHILKKADIIRIENTSKNIDEHKQTIFEYILIDLLEKMLFKKYLKKNNNKTNIKVKKNINDEWLFECYTIYRLLSYTIIDRNMILCNQIEKIINYIVNETTGCIEQMLSQSYYIIEKNNYLLKHADETLYEHQKQLFSVCKVSTPKLVLYIAPTGTGKTMSPLGLSTNHRVIFVCAARHVGLSLAKAAISMHKKIAFAFGCNDAEDIRLHYFAAKEYTRNMKSGGIGKVDNTQGEKVEIMISDVQSYLPAMLYMLAFNLKEQIITYWDEPTISMDYPEHELHAMINKNWTENLIPNMVLSSATLPQRNEINDTIVDFCGRFDNVDIHEIISYDCKKTIPLLNREGFIEMPHYLHSDYSQVLEVVEHCKSHKTLLRYIDLSEAVKFILTVQRFQKEKDEDDDECISDIISDKRYTVETHFTDIDTLTMANIKMFYLDLLGNLNPHAYPLIYNELCGLRKPAQESNVNIVTTDAHTLTDGPTIFLADDIHKIAQFYIQSAKIPSYVLKEVMDKIVFNRNLHEQIKILEKDLEDATTCKTSDGAKKDKTTRDDKLSPELKEKKQKLNTLNASIQTIILTPTYVPNTRDHLYKYAAKMEHANAFTCDISEETVEQIMQITDVEDYWKLLLLMGIGVFAEHKSIRYTEIMKKLAQEQKLFMIIASSDYIYGTNYQFCHGYIGKDLGDMTQEKCIQSMGRVGRNKIQQSYSVRFRDNALIYNLFHRNNNKPEVENMNRLFNTLI